MTYLENIFCDNPARETVEDAVFPAPGGPMSRSALQIIRVIA
jgi:hypothetical protein